MDKSKINIMLVMEVPKQRKAFMKVFSGLGCTITEADNGKEAIRYLRNCTKPDILILDLILKEMSANALLRIIVAESAWKDIKIVPYTKYYQYKWNEKELVNRAAAINKDFKKVAQLLVKHIKTVPGDTIIDVAKELYNKKIELPEKLEKAAALVENIKKL